MAPWRSDLFANCQRTGLIGALIGWYTSPGFAVASLYRIMRWGRLHGGLFGKAALILAWRRALKGYGCDISPGAVIGPGLRLPHPVGVVIGAGTTIGADVTIYQNVTLGRRSADVPANPVVGERVVIYAGAIVVGAANVGADAIIGCGVLVRRSVPAGSMVSQAPATISSPRTTT